MSIKEALRILDPATREEALSEYRTADVEEACRVVCAWVRKRPAAANRLASYEATGLEPEEVHKLISIDRWNKEAEDALYKFLQAEREERLIILPCKLSDTIYLIENIYQGKKRISAKVVFAQIDHFTIGDFGKPVLDCCTEDEHWYTALEPGDYYLTREDAEAALKQEVST